MSGSAPQFGERAEYGENDVCYRHPDRQSFVVCQRCGRTICPACQTQTPVGVLCPECVKETAPSTAQRVQRSATVTGRRIRALETPVTYGIIAVCVVVWLLQMFTAGMPNGGVTGALWYAPLYSLPPETGASFEPWRMLTAMFTHSTGSWFHILFNMYALWLFGRNLERLIGSTSFAALYALAGLGGSLGVMLWGYVSPQAIVTPTVGASGAIFGVLAATVVAYRAANVNVTSLVVLIAINVGIGFLPGSSISWQAHFGGMIVGAATMWALLGTRGPRKRGTRVMALTGIALLLVVLSFSYFVAMPGLPPG